MTKSILSIVLDTLPSKFPTNPDQGAFMAKLSAACGVAITDDKTTAAVILGPKMVTAGGCFATINHETEVIVMNQDANDAYWYSTIFHELGHATGSAKRLNRVGVVACDSRLHFNLEEIIAESVAMRIMETMGLATDQTRLKSFNYIRTYEFPLIMQGVIVDVIQLDKDIEQAEALVMGWINAAGYGSASSELKAA